MDVSIDKIFEYLSWNNSTEIQERGIALASNIKNLSVLIQPIENKAIWENCAKVLVSKSDEQLSLYLFALFEWLQDMNWPGADLIFDRLLYLSTEDFIPVYKHSLTVAKQTQDYAWEMSLKDLYKEFLLHKQ